MGPTNQKKMRQGILGIIKYRAWLFSYVFRSCIRPAIDRFVSLLQKQVFFTVILITVAVGFCYYVLVSDADMGAIAASETTGLPSLSALSGDGGEIIRSPDQKFIDELDQKPQ